MPPRTNQQRHEENIERVRELLNSRPFDLVRDGVVGDAISGARRKHPLPSIGYRSGKLTVTGYVRGARGGVSAIVVKCDCDGREYMVDNQNFKSFKSTRCLVCANAAAAKQRYWVYAGAMPDDEHRTRLLNRLSAAITRCHNSSCKSFRHYGGRGIHVYEQWRLDRASFLRYVQTVPDWDNPEFEMDRINNDKGYEPGNIRFCSRSANMHNRRQVARMQQEIDSLRHRLRRAEEQIHNLNGSRPSHRA